MARAHSLNGIALAMTLLIIALITVVTFMAVHVANMDARAVQHEEQGVRALYAARAGINMALSNLTGLRDTSFGNPEVLVEMERDVLSFRVRVEPHPNNVTPPRRAQLAWMVTSTGLVGRPPYAAQRTLQAFVQQEPFSRYAYFTNRETGPSGTVIHFFERDRITGPTHTNGFFTITGHPRFSETVRSANQGDRYYTPADPGPPPRPASYSAPGVPDRNDPANFYHVGSGNYSTSRPVALDDSPLFSMAGGQTPIPLPTDNGAILEAARDSSTVIAADPPPGPPGPLHYLNPANATATYTINYDENTNRVVGYARNGSSISWTNAPPVFQLRFTPAGAAVYRWDQTSNAFRAWDVAAANYAGSPTNPTILDTESQTMYVEGTCLLEGTVAGRTTLGVQYDAHITGNLRHRDRATDVLGLVANRSILVESPINVRRDRTIDAVLMALNGTFTVDKYDQGSPRGVLHLYGGIIQRTRGAVGTFSGESVSTGYSKNYVYDEKLVFRPPLNFPTTPNVYIVNLRDFGAAGSQ